MSIFNTKVRPQAEQTPVSRMVGAINGMFGNQPIDQRVGALAVSVEAMTDNDVSLLESVTSGYSAALESIVSTLGIKGANAAMMDAGVAAAALASNPQAMFARRVEQMNISTESASSVSLPSGDSLASRIPAFEAYDEKENRQVMAFSIAYNMNAARQDGFGELFFPTIVSTPDNVGFSITVRLMMVYNGFTRNTSGAIDQYNKRNILRALADPTLLKNDLNAIVPVFRSNAADKFSTLVPAYKTVLDGEEILTRPLACGVSLSLLAISQTDTLIANGQLDMTDSIDPGGLALKNIYVQIGDDILKFSTLQLPGSQLNAAPQGNYKDMQLYFDTTSILINKETKNADGSDLVTLKSVVTGDYVIRAAANVTGKVNVERGDTAIFGNQFAISQITTGVDSEQVGLSDAGVAEIVAAFKTAKIFGYDLRAYRTNANIRQNGQYIDTTYYTQHYTVPLRAPITALHPVTSDSMNDASDLSSLITATRIRTSNAAVTSLLEAASTLGQYVDARDLVDIGPDLLGVGRWYVRPTFHNLTMNMTQYIDSIKSHERAADIQAVLVNKIRDLAYRMYRDSEYKAAADALAGGLAPTPVVIIGTDPVLARYLTVPGDLRTLGNEFDVRIESTLDNRVKNKIFISFGIFDESRNVSPNPLNFGTMAWTPELTVVLPISRNGQVSKELVVMPRFQHIVNLPIMSVIEVTNLPEVLSKVTINTAEV